MEPKHDTDTEPVTVIEAVNQHGISAFRCGAESSDSAVSGDSTDSPHGPDAETNQ